MYEKLTVKQQMIFDFLKNEIRLKGYPPSIREICNFVGLSSTSTVHSHLSTLEKKGYIKRSPSKNRSIEVLEDDFYNNLRSIVNVPILGKVTAGLPILAVENIEGSMPVPLDTVNDDMCFFLRISGDSMIDAGIHNKDLVLVRHQPYAENGDIVVALLDDSATVKTFYKEKDHVRLQPQSPYFDPIIIKDVSIIGKVIGLYRKI